MDWCTSASGGLVLRHPVGRCKLGRGLSLRNRHRWNRYGIRLGAVDLHHAGGHDLDSQA